MTVSWFAIKGGLARKKLLAGLVLAAAVGGCYPGEILNIQDADIVVTAFDDSFDFSTVSTWAMPDMVAAIDLDGSNNIYSHAVDQDILDQIELNMAALGYTREMDPENNGADLIILVQANVSNNYTAYTYYPYDPYWGGYPPTTTVTNVKTGSIIIEMVDPNVEGSAEEGPSLTVRWAAVLSGLGEDTAAAARVTRAVDQAFDQSPYIGG